MKPSCLIRQASSPAGLVLPFFLCLLFFASSMVLAQKGKGKQVTNSILGVGIGASLVQAHAKLDRLSTHESRSMREDETREEETEEREGGRKEAWTLKATDYTSVALQTDREGRVVWITGFLRPGKEIPFAKLGNLSSAIGLTDSRAIWTVATSDGGYRLVAKGQNGKARLIYLLSLATPPVQ
jgi:hypothetical protein